MYHDFPYFFCMAAISSSVFEIFADDVVSNISKEIVSVKKKNFIIVLVASSDVSARLLLLARYCQLN